jgi:hypothetical protein
VLDYFEQARPGDERPRRAIELARAWGGAWAWNKIVVPRLREVGQTVHAMTLTGLGERTHLGSPQEQAKQSGDGWKIEPSAVPPTSRPR